MDWLQHDGKDFLRIFDDVTDADQLKQFCRSAVRPGVLVTLNALPGIGLPSRSSCGGVRPRRIRKCQKSTR
jgi:hypothetical protein